MGISGSHPPTCGRRWAAAALTIALASSLAACQPRDHAAAPDGAVGTVRTSTLVVGSETRTYRLYLPAAAAAATVVPLVVVLHGGFGSGEQAEKSYGWDGLADTAGFAVAYPDGLHRAWNVGGGCCGRPGADGVDDVGFVVAMVADIAALVPVDPERVFATGISNGGLLAYRLACDTTVFAAIGPDSATQLGTCPSPAPISVLHIHGTADTRIRLDGEQGDGVASIDGPPVAAVIESWRRVDGCAEPATTMHGLVTRSAAACPRGRTVELVTIEGAGHQWPSGEYTVAQRLLGLDEPSKALSATDELWAFFAAHPKQ